MSKKKIILVRHAESIANAGFQTSHAHSIPLSPKGLTQAEAIVNDFPIVPELIVTSSFLRTQQTAAPLISKTPDARVEVWDMIHEFTYLDREKQKNKTPEQRRPFAIAYWNQKDPFYRDGPEEESFYDLLKRIERFLEVLEQRKENTIAVFSHGQFLNALKIVKSLKTPVDQMTKEDLSLLMDKLVEIQEKTPISNAAVLKWDDVVM